MLSVKRQRDNLGKLSTDLVNVGHRPARNVPVEPGGPVLRWDGPPGLCLNPGEAVGLTTGSGAPGEA